MIEDARLATESDAAVLTYVEEVDESETQRIQTFPGSQRKVGEKGRLG